MSDTTCWIIVAICLLGVALQWVGCRWLRRKRLALYQKIRKAAGRATRSTFAVDRRGGLVRLNGYMTELERLDGEVQA